MSIYAIKSYYSELEKIIHYGGTNKETAIRNAFYNLLNAYAKQKNLMLITEISLKTPKGKIVTPDGTLKDILRLDWGYWEAKDESDILEEEIAKKFAKGYPKDNILFEDSQKAILIQGGTEIMKVNMKEAKELDKILLAFVNYEKPEIKQFREAIELFKKDIPIVTQVLREMIVLQEKENPKFKQVRNDFWELCQVSINPEILKEDITEMVIQHILTEDIFVSIFDETQFHKENNIAKELEKVVNTFFVKDVKREVMGKIQHYYLTIKAAASNIADHHEKQKFLKVVYENFYKGYNPKGADRLGIVYTPNEIVKFMIESTDYLLHKHFDKYLEDKGVEILDPATGTGTFITDIIDFIRKEKIEYKYKHEIHANEVAILPYYIANLNIEYTYKQKTGKYVEFENLCFMDTLDNINFLNTKGEAFIGKQTGMFEVSAENAERIKRQNDRKISVIIGNPPYNAKQENYNLQNANRLYNGIDQRIKETYIKSSTATKTSLYDMYTRFYRWAMDRLGIEGVISMITNRSFIDSRAFDGFRRCISEDFTDCYIIDTKSDVRTNPKIAGTTHNVFGIQTGVAIMFLIKKPKEKENALPCKIHYVTMQDDWHKDKKLQWFIENPLQKISFDIIRPDKTANWINLSDNDFETFIPTISKQKINQIFELFSNGVATQRDEWVYDFSEKNLSNKANFLVDEYMTLLENNNNTWNEIIKWSRDLKSKFLQKKKIVFNSMLLKINIYRPFTKKKWYAEKIVNDVFTQNHYDLFGKDLSKENKVIMFNSGSTIFGVLATNILFDYASLIFGKGGTKCISLYRYDSEGNRIENISNWALKQFISHYTAPNITKEDIFHYVYAVLHDPKYRQKYELNLKRDFPRIPFYTDFEKWVVWGKTLIDLHINYENAAPYPLTEKTKEKENPKAKLKAIKENGEIVIDESTSLMGVPLEAYNYKLGNRSAIEWVLDQYKESKPTDPTIREKFNTYKFADYKTHVIDLLKRVCTVSMETVKIVEEMAKG